MSESPPPLVTVANKVDAEHLKLLVIFHFMVAGLALLGVAFACLQWVVMQFVLLSPEMTKNMQGGPPPEFFLGIWKWFLVAMGVYSVCKCAGNLVSAFFIRQRRGRLFSLVVAGINCISVPFGTALGVCTFLVLLRPSVAAAYEAAKSQNH